MLNVCVTTSMEVVSVLCTGTLHVLPITAVDRIFHGILYFAGLVVM